MTTSPKDTTTAASAAARVAHGRIDLILGPMFSGKSTEMLRRIRRYTIAQKQCLVIKYARDTRYSVDKLATHDRMLWDSFPACRLADVPDAMLAGVDVVGIDEGQFFPDLVEWCDEQVNKHRRMVVVAALDGTFQRKPFGRVLEVRVFCFFFLLAVIFFLFFFVFPSQISCAQLVPFCDSVTKLLAVCMMCGDDAPFTARTTHEVEVEVIGGAEKYSAVCRKCFEMWA